MFAPVLNNVGPQLVQQGYANAANTQLQGTQALASGILSAGKSIGSGIGSALEGVKADATKYSQASGKLDAYRAYGAKNDMDTSFLDGIEQKYGKDPDKLLGALSVVGQDFDQHQKMQVMNAQYGQAQELARQKAALGVGVRQGSAAPMTGFSVGQGVDISR